MRKLLLSLFAFVPASLFAQALAMASKPDTSHGAHYSERVMVGGYIEFSSISNYVYDFKIMNRPYNLSVNGNKSYGIIGLMPLNEYLSLFAQAGYQKLSFAFADKDPETGYELVGADLPAIDSSDVKGKFDTHDIQAQLGLEVGLPLYSSYERSLLCKVYAFGTGMFGKMYFSDTKFESDNLFGYSWGGGGRIAWNRFAVMGGIRSSHSYWRTYFDPSKKTGEQSEDDTFMLDYNANFNPFVAVLFAFN